MAVGAAGAAAARLAELRQPSAAAQTEAELKALRHSVQLGTSFGSEAWVSATAERLGLQLTLRGRGRPRKVE